MTLFGVDLSHFNKPQLPDPSDQGVNFLTHKAGGDARDPNLPTWWAGVRELGAEVVLGAYWVLYPGRPEQRAQDFIDRLDTVCLRWRDRDSFILQVDCERWRGDPSTMPNVAEIKTFCDQLVKITGGVYRPVVYAPKWCYGDSLKGLPYPLWASDYVSMSGGFVDIYPGDSSSRWAPYSGQAPVILQYTSGGQIKGQPGGVDSNAFRGTLRELKDLVTPGKDHTMILSGDDIAAVSKAVFTSVWGTDGSIPNPGWRDDKKTNDKLTPASALFIAMDTAHQALVAAQSAIQAVTDTRKAILAAVTTAIASIPSVDVDKLAAALAPLVTEVTPEELKDAILASVRELANRPTTGA
jgi:GH25 family lysozyme M1 (1,4-beta-N-acetylmuramidase)